MNRKIFLIIIAAVFCCGMLFAEDYEISSMKIDVNVGRNAVHEIKEDYVFNYMGPHHGFFRYIPYKYDQGDVKRNVRISRVECSEEFESESEDGFYIMKIGSADKYLTGMVPYTISYRYDIGADTNSGYDEFYLNLVGDGWEVPIRSASFRVFVPCSASEAQIWITTGYRGSTQQLPFSVSETEGGIVITGSVPDIAPRQAVTIRVQLPDGWYQDARRATDLRGLFTRLAWIASFVVLALAIILKFTLGRDRMPIIHARFSPPEGMSPLPVGYVADNTVDDKDMTSMIYYWADAGYLRIEEPKKNKFEFTKLKNLPLDTPSYERRLFNAFFRKGEHIALKDVGGESFYEAIVEVKKDVEDYFSGDRCLTDDLTQGLSFLVNALAFVPPILFALSVTFSEYIERFFMIAFLVIAVFLNFSGQAGLASAIKKRFITKNKFFLYVIPVIPFVVYYFFTLGFAAFSELYADSVLLLVCTVCSFASVCFGETMIRRSRYGNKLFEEIFGYREFIDKTSVDELKMMIKETPDLYYHVLSYAIVLGLEDTWAKKFESITIEPPSWYVGDYMLNAYFFSRMSARMQGSLNTSFMAAKGGGGSRLIGGGGFGSSGFSGGGFGGGGGRAW